MSATDVKVVQLRPVTNSVPLPGGEHDNSAPQSNAEARVEVESAQSRIDAPPSKADAPQLVLKTVKRTRRWVKRSSPANALARALEGGRSVPFALLERVLEQPQPDHIADLPPRTHKQAQRDRDADAAEFWQVWLDHRDHLRVRALRYSGGNLADAEDALSEAMIKAAQTFSSTAIRNHHGWLLRLVHNACMDRHRSNRRQSRLAKEIADADARAAPAVAIQPDRSPEELLAAAQQIGDLERALRALPAFLAEPLFLYLDELSDAEIAGSLNVSKEVVRKRRQIARALIRRQISL